MKEIDEIDDTDEYSTENDTELTGLKIKTEIGNFLFCPTFIIKDKLENPMLYLKFNRKEKLVLYHTNEHPESKSAAEKFKKEFIAITKVHGENWVVSDIIEFIKEIFIKINDVKLNDFGIIAYMKLS